MAKFVTYLCDESGAVMIDWVALTAGILLLGIMVVYAIFNQGVVGLVNETNSMLQGASISANLGVSMDCTTLNNCP